MNKLFHQPPKIAQGILKRFMPHMDRAYLSGDFDEIYNSIREEGGKSKADFWYWSQLVQSLPQIPMDNTVIERAAKYGFMLDRKGKTVPTTDLFIAAAAKGKAVILHVDRDFETIGSIVDLRQEKIDLENTLN